jgi:hypothetical protein
MDQYNGILLSANLDALFDQYLISFADDGSLMISDLLPENEVRRLRLSHETNIRLKDEHKVYLKHHRMQFETKRSRGPVA